MCFFQNVFMGTSERFHTPTAASKKKNKAIKTIKTRWKMDWALTATLGPLGMAGRTGTTAGTTMTGSAAATGASAAAPGRLLSDGFACSHGSKTRPSEVSYATNWEVEPGLVSGTHLHSAAGLWNALLDGAAGLWGVGGGGVRRSRTAEKEQQHRWDSQLLQDSVSGHQPAATVTTWTSCPSQQASDFGWKRALTLLEPSAGAPAGIICGDQTDHFNLSLLWFYSVVWKQSWFCKTCFFRVCTLAGSVPQGERRWQKSCDAERQKKKQQNQQSGLQKIYNQHQQIPENDDQVSG